MKVAVGIFALAFILTASSLADLFITVTVKSNGVIVTNIPVIVYGTTNLASTNWYPIIEMNSTNTLILSNKYPVEFFKVGPVK